MTELKTGRQRAVEIVAVASACCALQLAVELNIGLSYPMRSAVKVLLFMGPVLLWCKVRGVPLKPIFIPQRRALLLSLALGVAVFGIIFGAWFAFRGFIDPSAIAAALSGNLQVEAGNFIWVFLYIILINCLVEEIFFRGFAFLVLRKLISGKWAGWFSASVFAVYHVGMLRGWFSPLLFLLAIAGLLVGGLIFNRLDDTSGSIYPGWLVHLFANLAINTLGCVVLGIF